jgi:hypothetical protein
MPGQREGSPRRAHRRTVELLAAMMALEPRVLDALRAVLRHRDAHLTAAILILVHAAARAGRRKRWR